MTRKRPGDSDYRGPAAYASRLTIRTLPDRKSLTALSEGVLVLDRPRDHNRWSQCATSIPNSWAPSHRNRFQAGVPACAGTLITIRCRNERLAEACHERSDRGLLLDKILLFREAFQRAQFPIFKGQWNESEDALLRGLAKIIGQRNKPNFRQVPVSADHPIVHE